MMFLMLILIIKDNLCSFTIYNIYDEFKPSLINQERQEYGEDAFEGKGTIGKRFLSFLLLAKDS